MCLLAIVTTCGSVFGARKWILLSLRLKTTVHSDKARQIVKWAERALLRERMYLTHQRNSQLSKQCCQLEQSIKERCHDNDDAAMFEWVSAIVRKSQETSFERSKMAQVNKVEKLSESLSLNKDKIDLSGTQLKKWVKVLSKYKPSDSEMKVLAKGLNFAVSPNKIPSRRLSLPRKRLVRTRGSWSTEVPSCRNLTEF